MIQLIKNNLLELDNMLVQIKSEHYSKKLHVLSGASVGQHTRHILELFQSLLNRTDRDSVCYDERKREPELENNPNYARQIIRHIFARLDCITADRELILKSDFTPGDSQKFSIRTSLFRELAYNLEHSIHHQALIKIGVNDLSCAIELDQNFGVAPATIRYRKQICVQ